MVLCPECESNLDIEVEDIDEGEIVSCTECGKDFEVITVNPLEMRPLSSEDEEDEEDEEEEEF